MWTTEDAPRWLFFYLTLISHAGVTPEAKGTTFLDPGAIGSFGLVVYSACFNQLFSLLQLDGDSPAAG